ncbi:protein of unknown function [Methanoculleus bourgensis]|uniref:Uncharacterized protein n=1 Tax=Methanoculleus bourgensis TaxID=83986 RepID=A0A0X3BN57_9EURY|nr:protein of unknown function [Methanoculleus bourgensis]
MEVILSPWGVPARGSRTSGGKNGAVSPVVEHYS